MRKQRLSLTPVFAVTAFLTIICLIGSEQGAAATPTPFLSKPPNAGPPGIYAFYDWKHISPSDYPIVAGHAQVQWNYLQNEDGEYNWWWLENWLSMDAALGKRMGVGIATYNGACCGGMGVPDYVFQLYPSAKVVCSDGEAIPKYWDAGFQQEYRRFVQALGQQYDGDPRIAFLEVGVGVFGETQPAYDDYDECLIDAGLTSQMWTEYVEWVVDIYREAFPTTPLTLMFAPRFLSWYERRDFTDYAAQRGVGLEHCGLEPDGDGLIIDDPNFSYYGTGMYDPIVKWGKDVLVVWEGTEIPIAYGIEATMWRLYNGLDKHPDVILLDYAQIEDPARWYLLDFANAHAGRTLADTPSVWVAMRETEYTWFPQWGNYSFWLYQNDAVPGGRTVPLWRVGSAPEGRYTRRTDSASGNAYMYFNVDDGYLFDGTNHVTINITYRDQGNDTWELQYDSTTNVTKSAGVVTKTNSGQWKKVSFVLDDARFANRQPGGGRYPGSDFRIWNRANGDETIHFVQVIADDRPVPTPTPTPTQTNTPTPDATPSATPTATRTPVPPQPPVECPRVPVGMTLDGNATEWAARPSILLNSNTAETIESGGNPTLADLSAEVWCGWQGNDLVLAARISDDHLWRDSALIWHDDGIELSMDGLRDGWHWYSADDHQFTVATDGSLTDLGNPPGPGSTVVTRTITGGWSLELFLPESVIGTGELAPGRVISFTIGLNEDDDGGSRDDHMIWRGKSTNSKSEEFGAIVLSGAPNTPTPTPEGGTWPTATATATATATPTVTATPTATPTSTPSPTSTPTTAPYHRSLECPSMAQNVVVDGHLDEWAQAPTLALDLTTADYLYLDPAPSPADNSAAIRCGWQGDDLILAGRVRDNVVVRDSQDVWNDDAVEFGIDGNADRLFHYRQDDHMLTLVVDGTLRDFGDFEVPEASRAISRTVDGWQFELRVPASALGVGPFASGQHIGFTVALDDDDDGGERDGYMVWEGQTAFGAPQNYGVLILTGEKVHCSTTGLTGPFAVAISRAGNAVKLDWADYGGSYDVRYSTTNPYFTPRTGDSQWLPVPPSNTATLADQLGDPGTHHFYAVQVRDCVDGWISSGRTGEFEFNLVPGAP